MTVPNRTPADLLAEAQKDLATATSARDERDEYRQTHYARSARDTATEAVVHPDATPEQRTAARACAAKAATMTGELAAVRRRARAPYTSIVRSAGVEID
jgi:hypothetical protein